MVHIPSLGAGALRWVRSHKRSTISVALVTAAATVLSVLAFTYEGFTTTDVDLHDGSVWVTRTESSQLGHLNVQAEELDGGLTTQSDDFDVLQDGDDVLLVDRASSTIQRVDPVGMRFEPGIAIPGLEVSMAAGIVSLLDPLTGDLFAYPIDQLTAYNPEAEPLAELGEGAAAVVARDGSVHAASIDDAQQIVWAADGDGGLGEPEVTERPELADATVLSMTAVGDEPVVLDVEASRLLLPDAVVDVPEDAVLQHASEAADDVLLATGEERVVQPLDGSEASTDRFSDAGEPVAPVQSGGCMFGVWPGSGTFVRECTDPSRDLTTPIEDLGDGELVFRENRGIVVLNQVAGGNAWIVTDQVTLVDNWEALIPETSDETEESDEDSLDDELVNQPPPQSDENTDPVANDDDFGVRAGRTAVVPVLWNDTDADGDVLTVTVEGGVPDGVRVAPVQNGSRLQVEVPADFDGGAFAIEYRVDDGRGGSDTANATVGISGDGANAAPSQLLDTVRMQVEQTAEIEYQALQNFVDPDGDDMYLERAEVDSGDAVQVSPDGTLRFTATGDAGAVEVRLFVSDGTEVGEGSITIDVTERGESTPLANADSISTVPGVPATLYPIRNDYVGTRTDPRLAAVNNDSPLTIEWDGQDGSVTILDGPVGTHYLTYQLAVGPALALGRIRVDVREPDDAARPVAVRDIGLLPQGRDTLVDLLANDVDPAGGVLVVQSVDVSANARASVELLERSLIRVTDNGLTEPIEIGYTISNGTQTAFGTAAILPVAPPAQPRPPEAVDDTWTLREGDYTTIPITDNDFSPDGTDFEVDPVLVESSLDGEQPDDVEPGSIAFIDGDVLRMHVPVGGPSSVRVVYQVVDVETGQAGTATVDVEIVRRDPEDNGAPRPERVTSRVLAGSEVRIPIPLDGIDPDGDGVELLRYDTAPDLGIITETGAGYFDFEADPDASGTVVFEYRVRDRWGAEATAQVLIGIAQPGASNQAPDAVVDEVRVQPDRAIAVDVLANDSDPDGDAMRVTAVASDQIDGVEVDEDRGTVDFIAPTEPGDSTVSYTVTDARGAVATGVVLVTVDPDAPPEAPIAVDDVVLRDEIAAGEPFDVDVLANDLEPDGDPSELTTAVVTGPGDVVAAGIQVTPSEDDFQVVTYEVEDVDGLTAQAFVFVPQAGVRAPWLLREEVRIPSGTPFEIPLADYVGVSSTNSPRLTTEDSVSATWATGDGLVADEGTLVYESERGYRGPAAITFEVTDGVSADDPEGLTSVLTLRIDVTESSAVPPEFASPTLQVAQGEDGAPFQLVNATTDPDPGDLAAMEYELMGGTTVQGVSASIDAGTRALELRADFDAVPGDSGEVLLRVTDPAGNQLEARVFIEVVPSTQPLPQARPDTADGVAGETTNVAVLANDFNPFARQGEPLTIVDAVVLTPGAGAAGHDGTAVDITPGTDFSGQMRVQYTVQDRTQTVQRQVTGEVTVTVINRPEPPSRPNVQSVGNREVTLSWQAPYDNGASITGYRVESTDGSVDFPCQATTCTVTGLTNDVTYTFQVIATNEVGDSDPGAASAEARPDVRPGTPAAPQAERGDQLVDLTWAEPSNEGSAITGYTIEISPPAPDGSVQRQVTGLAYQWTGLTNGTEYTFRIQASNRAPEPSEFSPYSSVAIPAGPPTQVQGVTATRTQLADIPQIQLRWQAADPNGDRISSYVITPYLDGVARPTITVGGADRAYTFEGAVNSSGNAQRYTFTVYAANEPGPGQPSAATAPIRDVTRPGAPTGVQGTDGDNQSTITFQAGAANGAAGNELVFQYRVNQGGVAGQISSGQSVRLANTGGPYTVQVRAVSTVDGVTYAGDWSAASNQIRPFGLPPAPRVTASGSANGVTFTWASNGTNGRALQYLEWTNQRNGQVNRVQGATNGSTTVNVPAGQQACITAIVVDSEGQSSAGAQDCATVPNPSISLQRGPQYGTTATCNDGQGRGCYFYRLHWQNLPTGTYNYQCFNTGSQNGAGNPFNQPNPGTVQIGSENGQTTSGNSQTAPGNLCFSSFQGDAWMRVWGNGIDIETPRIAWRT